MVIKHTNIYEQKQIRIESTGTSTKTARGNNKLKRSTNVIHTSLFSGGLALPVRIGFLLSSVSFNAPRTPWVNSMGHLKTTPQEHANAQVYELLRCPYTHDAPLGPTPGKCNIIKHTKQDNDDHRQIVMTMSKGLGFHRDIVLAMSKPYVFIGKSSWRCQHHRFSLPGNSVMVGHRSLRLGNSPAGASAATGNPRNPYHPL